MVDQLNSIVLSVSYIQCWCHLSLLKESQHTALHMYNFMGWISELFDVREFFINSSHDVEDFVYRYTYMISFCIAISHRRCLDSFLLLIGMNEISYVSLSFANLGGNTTGSICIDNTPCMCFTPHNWHTVYTLHGNLWQQLENTVSVISLIASNSSICYIKVCITKAMSHYYNVV